MTLVFVAVGLIIGVAALELAPALTTNRWLGRALVAAFGAGMSCLAYFFSALP